MSSLKNRSGPSQSHAAESVYNRNPSFINAVNAVTIDYIIEIKGPIDLAKVRMTDGSVKFVSKAKLNHTLIKIYRAEIRGESKDGQL